VKKALLVVAAIALVASMAAADQVLYREAFDRPTGAALDGSMTHWGCFYVKSGSPGRWDRYWGTVNNNTPAPTANSLPTYPWPQASGQDSISQSISVIDSRFIVGSMSAESSFDYWGGAVDWNAEYKPSFHGVTKMQFDTWQTGSYDKTYALIYTGGHWYVSQDFVADSNPTVYPGGTLPAAAGSWEAKEINWQTTKWDQLVDDIDQWKTWADPNAPFVARDVSTANFGVVDTWGFMNWETNGSMGYDNITLLPEPATMTLLGLGIVGLLRRR
jgi:hypothetical protein